MLTLVNKWATFLLFWYCNSAGACNVSCRKQCRDINFHCLLIIFARCTSDCNVIWSEHVARLCNTTVVRRCHVYSISTRPQQQSSSRHDKCWAAVPNRCWCSDIFHNTWRLRQCAVIPQLFVNIPADWSAWACCIGHKLWNSTCVPAGWGLGLSTTSWPVSCAAVKLGLIHISWCINVYSRYCVVLFVCSHR